MFVSAGEVSALSGEDSIIWGFATENNWWSYAYEEIAGVECFCFLL